MSKSEGQVLDFEKICRLCLLEKRSMSSIFSKKKSDKKVPLPVRIMSCASLELYEGDGLPASICSKCLLSVNQSYAFREQCEQADTTLRQYAQRMNEASGETSLNRELGEHCAKGSLEHIEDNGIKFEEDRIRGSRSINEDHFGRNNWELHCENVAISSGEFVVNIEENEELIIREREDVIEPSVTGWEGIGCFEGEEKGTLLEKINSEISGKIRFNKRTGNGSETRCKMNKMRNTKECRVLDTLQVPMLKRLSEAKVEDKEVISDAPAICEGGDCHLEETVSPQDCSAPTTRSRKKKDFVSSATFDEEQLIIENLHRKNGFEKEKHFENHQCSIKNKNVVLEKRAPTSCGSAKMEEKISNLKNHDFGKKNHQQKNCLLPCDLKVTQFWRKWKEVKKTALEVMSEDKKTVRGNINAKETDSELPLVEVSERISKDDCAADGEHKNSVKTVLKINGDQKSDSNRRTKWKNAKDTVYCKECRIFLMRSSYNNHIKFVHKKIRKYLCQTCGYAAYTGTILRQHVQAVHVGYSFFCDQCPKKFNLMKRLRKHIEWQHSGKPVPRNHVCQYCGMAFSKPGCLTRHLRSHTQETPYQCQYCHRRFKYLWPKVQHERLHTGEKPYKCSYCEERFTQNCVRKAHEYKKHGNQEFKPKARIRRDAAIKTVVVRAEAEGSEASTRGSCNSGLEPA